VLNTNCDGGFYTLTCSMVVENETESTDIILYTPVNDNCFMCARARAS